MNTFDLQYRASLGYNATLNATDENNNYMPYQNTFLNSSPNEQRHIISGFESSEIIGRYIIGLNFARNMLGIKEQHPIEKCLVERLEKVQDECKWGLCSQPSTEWSPSYKIAPWAEPQRMMFESFLMLYENGAKKYEERLDRYIEGVFSRKADWSAAKIHKEDAETDFNLRALSFERLNPYTTSWLVDPLVRYYKLTGKPRVMELLELIIKEHPMLNDPEFKENNRFKGHAHTMLSGVIGLIRYSELTGNNQLMEKCVSCYGWFVTCRGSSTGWCTELVNDNTSPEGEDCETCVISNLIEIAVLLGRITGKDKYWTDAECFCKNQLMEQQLIDTDWIPLALRKDYLQSDNRRSFAEVPARSIGTFHGNASPNDFIGNNPPCHFRTMTGCCNAWGLRALYLVWHSMVSADRDGSYSVNMQFNRDSNNMMVRCYEPFQGKIEIRMKTDGRLRVRIPMWRDLSYKKRFTQYTYDDVMERWGGNWMDRRFIRCMVNGKIKIADAAEAFIDIGGVKSGDKIEVLYPLRWDKHEEIIGGRKYTLEWLGSTCVGLEPKGLIRPLYQRQWMKFSDYPIKAVTYPYSEKEFNV